MILHRLDVLYGNHLAIDSGEQPAASVDGKITVNSQKYASRIASCNDSALFIRVNVHNIVQLDV